MKKSFVFVALLLALILPAVAPAQTTSNTVAVPVSLNIGESISLTLSTNSITLSTTAPSQTITLTPSWQVQPGHTSATIYAWMSTVPTFGSNQIISTDFSTQFNGGAAQTCDQSAGATNWPAGIGFGGRNCNSYSIPNIGTDLNDSQSVAFTVTYSAPTNVPVGTYTGGTINLAFEII